MEMMRVRGLALLALVLCVSAAWAEETATFKFAPPARVVTVTKATTTHTMNDETEVTVEEAKNRTVTTRTDKGFEQVSTLFYATKSKDGEATEISDHMRCFLDVDISATMDATGKLLTLRGFDTVAANAKQFMSKEDYASVGAMYTEKMMKDAAFADYQAEIGDFIGRTVKAGDTWKVTSKYPLPDGSFTPSTITYTVAGFKTVAGKRCAVVKFAIAVDMKVFSKALTKMFSHMEMPPGVKPPTVTLTRYVDEGERCINPDTLQILKETHTTYSECDVKVQGLGAFTMSDREVRESRDEADNVWRAVPSQPT